MASIEAVIAVGWDPCPGEPIDGRPDNGSLGFRLFGPHRHQTWSAFDNAVDDLIPNSAKQGLVMRDT